MNRQHESKGCLFAILKLLGIAAPDAPAARDFPYQRKDYLLTRAERSFFGVLQTAIANRYLLFAKVRLADLVFIPRGTDKRQSHFNRVQSKHIDFVLCDHDVVRPLLAIELDDSSHERADRQARDGFVDSALAAAGLPILHVPARSGYNVQELANAIQEHIRT